MARAVVGVGRHLDTRLCAVTVDHFLEHVALGIGLLMRRIAEDEWVIRDAYARIATRRERWAADDHVDRAERQALINVGLFAER